MKYHHMQFTHTFRANYGIVIDPIFERHLTPAGHPEKPSRITALLQALENWNAPGPVTRVVPQRAQEEWILAVHAARHFEAVRETSGVDHRRLDADTSTSADSFDVAMAAAGSVIALLEGMGRGDLEGGFALVRPPGHHAQRDRIMGFCLFNNVAVAAQWAIDTKMARKVAVVDFDVHHGNGTQEIFYARSDVLYLSTHQYPFYPGTGHFSETGSGAGEHFTVNFPLQAGTGDHFYCTLFEEPAAAVLRRFEPELILVSAGYDAHHLDPLGGMSLTTAGFGRITNLLNQVAREVCPGRILYVLEGGYNLKALAEAVLQTIDTTLKPQSFSIPPVQEEAYRRYRRNARQWFRYWDL